MKTIEGDLTATTARFAIVAGRFNGFVVESMVAAAVDTLRRHGVDENSITPVSYTHLTLPTKRIV